MIDWRHWHNEPHLIGGLVLLGWLYAIFTGPLRHWFTQENAYPRAHAWKFYTALVVFYLAVGSPLDQVGERFLLSAHMIQHQLLIYVSAVLFLLGLPTWLLRPITSAPKLRPLLRVLSHPIICGLLYTLVLSVWHAPDLYDFALRNKNIHVLEHLMFFGAALFYWWPLLSPAPEYPPLSYAGQIIYAFAVTVGMTPVFAFLAFSNNVLYPTYEYAPRLFASLGPAEDQLLGAVIMKAGSLGVALFVIGAAFYRWSQKTGGPTREDHSSFTQLKLQSL
ncbi:MAG: cytochrome c oxidase assembly protein [Nibricoccus sp.]